MPSRRGAFRWRRSAPKPAQDDIDDVLRHAFDFAQQQLDVRGEFFPYGIVMDTAGQQRIVAADPGGEHPTAVEVYDALLSGLTLDRDTLRVAVIIAAVSIAETGGDAIRAVAEHRDGVSLAVLLPYWPDGRDSSNITYGERWSQPADAAIWPRA